MIKVIRRGILGGVLAGVVLAGALGVSVEAQAPFSAQIQAALRVFITTAHTWASGTVAAPTIALGQTDLGFFRYLSGLAGFTTPTAGGGLFFFGPTVNNGISTAPSNQAWGYIRNGDVPTGGISIHGYTATSPTTAALELAGRTHDAATFPAMQFTVIRYTTPNGFGQLPITERAYVFCEFEAVSASGCDHIYWDMRASGKVTHSIWATAYSPVNGYSLISTPGYILQPAILASAGGAPSTQMSPYFSWLANAWDTAASETVEFRSEVVPTSAAVPTGLWRLAYSLNNAAASTVLSIDSTGKTLFQGVGSAGAAQLASLQTTPPTCTTNCGTSVPTQVGSDSDMMITLGTTPASGFVVNFNKAWAAAPTCTAQMAKAGMVAGAVPLTVVASTSIITVVTNGTAPSTGDKYAILCRGTQ